jgi:hypothetical protein
LSNLDSSFGENSTWGQVDLAYLPNSSAWHPFSIEARSAADKKTIHLSLLKQDDRPGAMYFDDLAVTRLSDEMSDEAGPGLASAGFEDGPLTPATKAEGFGVWYVSGKGFSVLPTSKQSGNSGLHVTPADGRAWQWRAAKPGANYRLSVSIRAVDFGATPSFLMEFVDGQGHVLTGASSWQALDPKSSWQRIVVGTTAPPGTTRMRVTIGNSADLSCSPVDKPCSMDWDDFDLVVINQSTQPSCRSN